MDIANSAPQEQPGEGTLRASAEPAPEEQETPSSPDNVEPTAEGPETVNLLASLEPASVDVEMPGSPDDTKLAAGNAETPGSSDDTEPAVEGAETSSSLNAIEPAAGEPETLSSLDTVELSTNDAGAASLPENAASLARVPDALRLAGGASEALASGVPARKKSRYSPWLQIVVGVLLVCLVGGIVLATQLPRGASGSGRKVQGTPTPVPPLKITGWCTVNSAVVDPQAGQVSLQKIVPLSANDTWLLGGTSKGDSFHGNTGRDFPLLEHWNGKTWSIAPTANTSALLNQLLGKVGGGKASEAVNLNDMVVLSDQNIWAVGSISVTKLTPQTLFGGRQGMVMNESGQPLIEHWDGNTWQIVASPKGYSGPTGLPFSSNDLTQISAVSANDIWAIGTQESQDKGQPVNVDGTTIYLPSMSRVPLIEHWDGTSWTEQKLPASLLKGGSFLSNENIQAISSNDVWSFGTSMDFILKSFQPASPNAGVTSGSVTVVSGGGKIQDTASSSLLHWNGQDWKKMDLPSNLGKTAQVQQVTVISDNDIWAIVRNSVLNNKQSYDIDTVYHWDGSTWSSVAGVNGADPKSNLNNFSVLAPNNLWLLGNTSQHQPLMQHWDGKTWSTVSPTSPAYGSVQSMAVAGHRAWALVDEYTEQAAQKVPAGVLPAPIGTVLETNC